MTTRVFSTYVSTAASANVTIVARRARLKSFVLYNNGAADGLYTFKDDSAAGTTLVQVMVKLAIQLITSFMIWESKRPVVEDYT